MRNSELILNQPSRIENRRKKRSYKLSIPILVAALAFYVFQDKIKETGYSLLIGRPTEKAQKWNECEICDDSGTKPFASFRGSDYRLAVMYNEAAGYNDQGGTMREMIIKLDEKFLPGRPLEKHELTRMVKLAQGLNRKFKDTDSLDSLITDCESFDLDTSGMIVHKNMKYIIPVRAYQ